MAGYKEIKGFQVQTRSEDPSPTEVQTGDFYYNSTTGQFRVISDGGAPIGTWASGGNLNTSRGQPSKGSGTQTAAIIAGGKNPSSSPVANAEQYNGSSWTEVSDLNTSRSGSPGSAKLAPYTATIIFGGESNPSGAVTTNTETWDGSSWTEVNNLN